MPQYTKTTFGWSGPIDSFLDLSEASFLEALSNQHKTSSLEDPSSSQLTAWANCFYSLKRHLPTLIQYRAEAADWSLIFEYELPRERGRRPDVLVLAGDRIIVLEFKDQTNPMQAHIDQVAAYARDLKNYHAGSHGREVFPVLVLTKSSGLVDQWDEVYIHTPDTLPKRLLDLADGGGEGEIRCEEWLEADYSPLPSLVEAARTLFKNEPLPFIRRAQSAGIPETIKELFSIADQAQREKEHHLALVTGVPGAGKTLVGLQFVYTNHFQDTGSHRTSVFLSGNGPLVKVLQHALKSSVFVQDVHGFLRHYGGGSRKIPAESIFIFDEAQRAWDSERVSEKRGHRLSEPQDFLQIGQKKPWTLMIGLIGDGQEIHIGEEAGLTQWNEAIASTDTQWIVHCPNNVAHLFTAAKEVKTSEVLNLTASLRSHLAEDVQLWVKQVLENNLKGAAGIAEKIYSQGFDMYLTRDLEAAKAYVQKRYDGQLDKRYGLLASSKAKNLEKYGINNSYQWTRNFREGPWYNDEPDSRNSCCQLREVATEFACQGLELDFPIVAWGDDVRWHNHRWCTPPAYRSKARDPHQLRINSYRVLLTRGRDGFLVFVPKEMNMDSTYYSLKEAGLRLLES